MFCAGVVPPSVWSASLRASLVTVAVAIVAGCGIIGFLPAYWCFLGTAVLITAIALQSLGLVTGRAGMIALCQMSFAGVGAWTVGYLNVAAAPGGLAFWVLIGLATKHSPTNRAKERSVLCRWPRP